MSRSSALLGLAFALLVTACSQNEQLPTARRTLPPPFEGAPPLVCLSPDNAALIDCETASRRAERYTQQLIGAAILIGDATELNASLKHGAHQGGRDPVWVVTYSGLLRTVSAAQTCRFVGSYAIRVDAKTGQVVATSVSKQGFETCEGRGGL